ncbi:MAG TPA: hypothetical protein VFW94_07340 [Candidatus Acidoferrales bacterium]|nr:hypothetical protein [Candidatus Acidoferrales bacterium]
MRDAEYEQLVAVAEREGLTLGEWCRDLLLERVNGRKEKPVEDTLLAELIALRTILLNAFYKQAQGETLTADEMQRLINHADKDKFRKAQERLAAATRGAE